MKKLLFTCFTLATGFLNSQLENTVPTEGNVGLGTLSPNAKLDVKGTVHIDSTLKVRKTLTAESGVEFPNLPAANSSANKEFVLIKSDGGIEKIYGEVVLREIGDAIYEEKGCGLEDLAHPTWSNGLNKLYSYCPEVRVGIATNEPRFNLDVRGTAYANKLALGALNTESVPAAFYLRSAQNQQANEKLFLIENAGRKVFQINNNGLVQAREMKLDVQNWPDYVFKADYRLPSLKEVEQHIAEQGHLPKVPAAEDLEEEGLDLAEMDKILMEKVEEITLYLIELNKQIEKQGRQITALEHQLEK